MAKISVIMRSSYMQLPEFTLPDPLSFPQAPELSWRDDGQPVSVEFDDPYFSVENGLEESRYVFLQHNGLPERWADWQGSFCITETGFGTGLNFLMTWQSWRQHQNHKDEHRWLHFTSIEKFPMTREQLQQALALWPELQELSSKLAEQYPLPVAGFHVLQWPEERISLTLIFDDVKSALAQLTGPVHAWYLDGFAPSKNPTMWNEELFAGMRRLSLLTSPAAHRHDPLTLTSVATFTAAGLVRRGLLGAGFGVKRVKGYGRKREMVCGYYNRRNGPEQPAEAVIRPWQLAPAIQRGHRIAVIGAGLAGATTARALADRGFEVTVFDQRGIAQAASGNPQGGLYVKLAANDQAIHTDFYLQAFQLAVNTMSRILGRGDSNNPYWQQCGVLQLAYDDKEQQRQQKFSTARAMPQELVYALDQQQASKLAGSEQKRGGLFFPQAGWVSPADLCQTLLQHSGIRFVQGQVSGLKKAEHGWQFAAAAEASDDRTVTERSQQWTFDQLVICTAADAQSLLPDAYLPVKTIRGQLSYLRPELTPALNTVLCGRSYMAPAQNGRLVLGATYNLRDDENSLRDTDHQTNLNHLSDFGPQWQQLADNSRLDAVQGGRVGFRCTTPDYLPMTGPVPDTRAFIRTYSPMVQNAKRIPAKPVPNLNGLWLNIGHGSRGLASGPLCAALLAAQISGDSLPVSAGVAEALWPGRFLLRDMVRRKLPPQLTE
ncbi:bifunctional tRNA (5-methylaminomethyl-2-thiouridine)(34)-methyltransferase MnmD/FAD-dependent 5-carboxymethylaminomethyl-2-thiouridine(34) oxidoreductase MnmC [Thalassolituus sp. UBA6592]|uniref:bifunctional tRNA (5-methylaminomethyl-2-thiouridine)(34)-methyltransferase MnmD/FAD-dependent 5-carboxymethylaminomethyl-2-thiouridine(34) oxidoreductase MnmC n=1 Tax=Thalassolituus sp. UBA6592 TaxID=1947665 RepID=UPI0025F33582|nr:bifunctional tRNA (5-methylaminomethyl-2-thiouridine)(34)-methyltransferase MnmD/FAD-dependent 5-carboxymethylaminomethyl-2-thiouridine(34) oxidoreductase MnmC [Thalassolituus sp. UBA6592]